MEHRNPRTVELDVRPQLRNKLEPFKLIMDTVKTLSKDDTFVLHATIKPTPLLTLMKTKGFVGEIERVADDHWVTTFRHKSRKKDKELTPFPQLDALNKATSAVDGTASVQELDNRGLQPPQPMVRTLKALEDARSGDRIVIHNDRVPMFLIEELNELGFAYEVWDQPDGSAKVMITKS